MASGELDELWRAARAARPELGVGEARFRAFVSARAGTATGLHGADLYLACACLDGDAAALRAFEALLAEVGRKLRHMAADDQVLADAQQIVRQVLLPRGDRPAALSEYNGRGELGGWLRVTLARELVRLSSKERRHARLDTGEAALVADANDDPETSYLKAHYQNEFKQAFLAAMALLDDEERRALRYAVVERLSIDEVAKLERVHRATAARQVARARARLADETRRALEERLDVAPEQLQSILRLVSSQLDVSVRRILSE